MPNGRAELPESGMKPSADHRPCLRPVAQDSAHHARQSRAGTQKRNTGRLKSDLQPAVNFQHGLRREEDAALAQVDSLARKPVLLPLDAITQRYLQGVALRSFNPHSRLACLRRHITARPLHDHSKMWK